MGATDNDKEPEISKVERYTRHLTDGAPKYNLAQAAARAGTSKHVVRMFWRSMGFPAIGDEEKMIFTNYDVDVIRAHQEMANLGSADSTAMNSLIRAQSYFADRQVLWQYEALVEMAAKRFGVDEISARYYVLDHFGQYEDFLMYQMKYAWRRHVAAFLRRTEVELENMHFNEGIEMPLMRALGFVDLVSFTHTSEKLTPHELAELIQTFEFTCRDVISSYGARTVKMVGDAVLYIADDLPTAVRAVTGLIRALNDAPDIPNVRASLVWGGVLSRFGDVFGPNVNLASRLCSIAPQGGVLLDDATATAVAKLGQPGLSVESSDDVDLRGIGTVATFTLRELA
ncbi:adenylate/guanylate cyclase domain-containing protein [Arcanobacterium canis]|uniref:Adenylate/guanylate cyclase domain-containing protein n=1 Tax=Arcanobacterium canis TaxID=999183 RepID=A0ABY8G0C9_9ACTO|nr:adenylate/guanylate cyclase domain-containing protein [Arcanobacterium canis]WFM84184.1 adenylate/guanylate cyclase domain-containing protein [Arcanobacterium canis]